MVVLLVLDRTAAGRALEAVVAGVLRVLVVDVVADAAVDETRDVEHHAAPVSIRCLGDSGERSLEGFAAKVK